MRRATSSWLRTAGIWRGCCTGARCRTRSGLSNVILKKNRSAVQAWLMVAGLIMLLGEMQLIAAKVLGRRLVRRTAEVNREVLHGADVVPPGVLAEPARGHVVNHALPQRADRLVG